MSSDVRRSLRRIKPEKYLSRLARRPVSELDFVESTPTLPDKILLDTSVYIDVEQGRMSEPGKAALRVVQQWHSPVTEAELTFLCGELDPANPGTAAVIEEIVETIERRRADRVISPDVEIWREAGIYSGLLARLQSYGVAERSRVLHDALIFCTAMKHGLTIFSRNLRDFDLLQQLAPAGKVLFYHREG